MGRLVELETTFKKKRHFLIYEIDEDVLWVCTDSLPGSAFLCASFDGSPMMQADVGEKRKTKKRFLRADWLVKDWGGPKDLVEAIQKRIHIEKEKLESYREKYKDAEFPEIET